MARIAAGKVSEDWEAQYDLDTLMRASEIRKDPKRLKAAKACAKKRKEQLADQIGAVSSVQDSDNDKD